MDRLALLKALSVDGAEAVSGLSDPPERDRKCGSGRDTARNGAFYHAGKSRHLSRFERFSFGSSRHRRRSTP